jgi:hypothetical protein
VSEGGGLGVGDQITVTSTRKTTIISGTGRSMSTVTEVVSTDTLHVGVPGTKTVWVSVTASPVTRHDGTTRSSSLWSSSGSGTTTVVKTSSSSTSTLTSTTSAMPSESKKSAASSMTVSRMGLMSCVVVMTGILFASG